MLYIRIEIYKLAKMSVFLDVQKFINTMSRKKG